MTNPLFPETLTPTFSGHETFVLRSNWLKKGYDTLQHSPDLFSRKDAYVKLGVGKNMVHSIRYWGRVCNVFTRQADGSYEATPLGKQLLADDGWDPFLVTPASWWLLHWTIASRPEAAVSWFYTFNLLRGGEFTIAQLAAQIQSLAMEHSWRPPSTTTIERDLDCMVRCYIPPAQEQLDMALEDILLCPLTELGLMQTIPGHRIYRLRKGPQPTLPDHLVAYAILHMLLEKQQQTISFRELAYAPRSPGRLFCLDEDGLLDRLYRIEDVTDSKAYYSEQAGIRQVSWREEINQEQGADLLAQLFQENAEVAT